MPLIVPGIFVASAGRELSHKIECDALSAETLAGFASLFAERFVFTEVEGVPTGGIRFARALQRHARPPGAAGRLLLIADDVLTTGASMERQRAGREAQGVVLFARGPCPEWVVPIFQLNDDLR